MPNFLSQHYTKRERNLYVQIIKHLRFTESSTPFFRIVFTFFHTFYFYFPTILSLRTSLFSFTYILSPPIRYCLPSVWPGIKFSLQDDINAFLLISYSKTSNYYNILNVCIYYYAANHFQHIKYWNCCGNVFLGIIYHMQWEILPLLITERKRDWKFLRISSHFRAKLFTHPYYVLLLSKKTRNEGNC